MTNDDADARAYVDADRAMRAGSQGGALPRDTRCESCRRGFDGTKGNGYQPCSCKRPNAGGNPHE